VKIEDSQAAAVQPDKARDTPDTKKDGKFAKVLAKKADEKKPGEAKLAQPSAGVAAGPPAQGPAPVEKKDAAHAAHEPRAIQGLAQEITVAQSSNRTDVKIQLHSKVLDGLNIQITRQAGRVSVEFQTASPQVATLLTSNTSQLASALQARGIQVGSINVQNSPASTPGGQGPVRQPRGGRQR
jgi:flagellar hook-length control protein FliK